MSLQVKIGMDIRIDGEVLSGARTMSIDVDYFDHDVLSITSLPHVIDASPFVFIRNSGDATIHVKGDTDDFFDLEPDEISILRSPSELTLTCDTSSLAEVIVAFPNDVSGSLTDDQGNQLTDDQGQDLVIQ